jgi:phytoene dehydrogenase-like protein
LTQLDRATPSLSGFVLMLALRGRSTHPAHHTVLFPADYDDEFDSVFGSGRRRGRPRAVPDPTVYIAAPDDPALRPDEDHESWFVLVNAPRHMPDEPAAGVDWDASGAAGQYADRILEVMATRGVDVRDRLLWREIRTPADLERATGSVGGSIYGSSSNGARAAFLRPANRSPVPGLFLVGGSAHPGGGLPLVGLSAAIVADLVGRA